VYDGFTKDDTQWNWWLYYRELMTVKALQAGDQPS
jgi:hypothetical protein